ncbi:hypothetical protein BKA70DRAFT_672903 [Coprinopsis sp. MPI-PUGE-AT-0042]|nr:hypothetical protein BKA70DRAFT_672903 [Coprinopsis sp. MPI-PUGE-AT-0042]
MEPPSLSRSRLLSVEGGSVIQSLNNITINGGTLVVTARDAHNVNSTYFTEPGASTEPTLCEVLDWISAVNFRGMLDESLARQTSGTGSRLTKGTQFGRWISGGPWILWAKGMPGAGKTVLASIAIENIRERFSASSDELLLCFAYFRYTNPLSVRDVLAALVRQILECHHGLLPLLQRPYTRHRFQQTRPTVDELIAVLSNLRGQFKVGFCILDGLD